jgi:hypothetical protein
MREKFTAIAIEEKQPQIPNPKHQIANKSKILMSKIKFFWLFEFKSLEFIWDLAIGICDLKKYGHRKVILESKDETV